MGKPRACDVCSLRKIRCNYAHPCQSCIKAGFECSYAKTPLKPGPKGPRSTTSNRINKALLDIRSGNSIPQSPKRTKHAAVSRSPSSFDGSYHRETTKSPLSRDSISSELLPIPLNTVYTYLDAFSDKMYAIWPVVDAEALISELDHDMAETETLALTFSICAATGVQLRIKDSGGDQTQHQTSMIDRFASEAERVRKNLGIQEGLSLASVLIPFFLHVYYYGRNKKVASALCLREALTLCELLDLDKEEAYHSLPHDVQISRRKVFWLLFVTERGKGMLGNRTLLRPVIGLPQADDDKNPNEFAAFLKLVQLFIAVDDPIFGSDSRYASHMLTPDTLSRLQRELSVDASALTTNDIQKTDISVTQCWLRMLLWQIAVEKVSMTAGDPEDPFSLRFPSHVARDALHFLSQVSMESVIPHGPGIESKIFEIASTLLDVINVVPSPQRNSSALVRQEPREVFRGLSSLLATLSDGNSPLLALLQKKMAQSNMPIDPIPRLLEVEEETGQGPTLLQNTTNQSPVSNHSNVSRVEILPDPIQIRSLGMSDWVT